MRLRDIAWADVMEGPVEPAGAAAAIAMIKAAAAAMPGKVWRIIFIFKIISPSKSRVADCSASMPMPKRLAHYNPSMQAVYRKPPMRH